MLVPSSRELVMMNDENNTIPPSVKVLLSEYPVTEAGREYIERCLRAPARNVKGTTQNIVGNYPSTKLRGNIQSRSETCDAKFILAHEFAPETIIYTTEPHPLEICYEGRNGHTARHTHHPRCLVLDSNIGAVVEDWFPENVRQTLAERSPGKFVAREDGSYFSPPLDSKLNPLGIKHRIRFAGEISKIGHLNRKSLFSYLAPGAAKIYEPRSFQLLAHFTDRDCVQLEDLPIGQHIDVFYWMLATNRLFIDLDSYELDRIPPSAPVFRTAEYFRMWSTSNKPPHPGKSINPESLWQDFRVGQRFTFDGRNFLIRLVSDNGIYVQDDNSSIVFLDNALLHAGATKLRFPENTSNQHQSLFWKCNLEKMQRAIRKLKILEKLKNNEEISLQDTYSPAAIRRWCAAIRDGASRGLTPLESLFDEQDKRGFHGPHIDPDLKSRIIELTKLKIEERSSDSIQKQYDDIKKIIESEGRLMVAKSTFYIYHKQQTSYRTIRQSKGQKAAQPFEPTYWMLDIKTPVHCSRALELVHFDSTEIDLFLLSSLSGKPIGKAWLTIAICAYTRKIVGMHLSFYPPSYVSSMMTLSDIIIRHGRIPEAIIHDWGSEFRAMDFKSAITALNIIEYTRPKSKSRFGSICERMFGITEQEIIRNLLGCSIPLKSPRTVSSSHDPRKYAGLYLENLWTEFEKYFFVAYNGREHPTTFSTPDAAFDQSFILHGNQPHRLRSFEDLLPVLMPTAKGKPRKIDPVRGVFANHRYFGHPELTDLSLAGQKIVVKPLPFEPGLVLAFHSGKWIICKSSQHSLLEETSRIYKRCYFEEFSREKILHRKNHSDSREDILKIIETLNEQARNNIEYWKNREFNNLLPNHVLDENPDIKDDDEFIDFEKTLQIATRETIERGDYGDIIQP